MKKLLVVLIVLLFAGSAFAQDAAKKAAEFKYGFNGVAYGVKGQSGDTEYDYSHIRVRPSFSMGNDQVKGVVTFEIDQDFGAGSKDFDGNSRSSAANGNDNKDVEVKHAYFEIKDVIVPGLAINAGLNGFFMPLVIDNDFAMAQVSYDFGMGQAVFSFLKHQEGNVQTQSVNSDINTSNRDDIESYSIQLPIKSGQISVTPAFLYTAIGKEYNDFSGATQQELFDNELGDNGILDAIENEKAYYDGNLKNYAINVNGDFGIVTFDASYVYTSGKVYVDYENVSQGTDGKLTVKTQAFDAIATVKPDQMLKASLFFTMYSGDNKSADTKWNSHVAIMDQFYGAPDGRLFILDAAGVTANGGLQPFDNGAKAEGLRIYGLNAEATVDKFAFLAQYAYVQSAKDMSYTKNGSVKKTKQFAQEIDLKAVFEVAPSASLFVEYGYVVFNEDLGTSSVKEVAFGASAKI